MNNYNSNPIISIIQPTFNNGNALEKSIISVLNQSYNGIEYNIIDGGSNKTTIDIISKYDSKISFWVSEPDNGIYDALNKGIEKAKGDWLYFLGGDDYLYNDSIIEKIIPFLKDPNCITYGNSYWVKQKRFYDREFQWHKLINKNICHQSIFYPKKVFLKYRYNIRYPILADWDLNIKLWSDRNYYFKYVDLCICNFNDSNEGKTRIMGQDINFQIDQEKIISNAFGKKIFIRNIINIIKSLILKLLGKLK